MNNSKSACPNCGAANNCAVNAACWCMDYPNILPLTPDATCLCSTCLLNQLQRQATALIASEEYEKIKALGPVKKPMEGLDYEINQDGNLVFTSWYHLRRGTCCGSGCLNCPYGK